MCGFLGIWHKQGGGGASAAVSGSSAASGKAASVSATAFNMEELTAVFAHRGPDDFGEFSAGPVSLGFRRLKIIDLAGGKQPMQNEDGSLTLVFNGEIYNFPELRRELTGKGHIFKTNSDSEVILHLYEELGEGCVEKMRGMFAFLIYDRKKELLVGGRDRFGIKPLYYLETPQVFALASEAKALLSLPGYEKSVNTAAFSHYLSFQYVPEPRTMFSGIYKIPPAHTFSYDGRTMTLNRYWQAKFNPRDAALSEYIEGTQNIMREAVQLHTQSDVPWGAFLSGGIDSGIIVALLREMGPVSTFSVGYEDEDYSELSEARETARYLETDHQEYLINPEEFWEHLPRLVWHLDDPVADPAAISLFFVARMAREKITVTLSGEGADEVFGGYGIYREPSSLRPVAWLPGSVLNSGARILPDGLPGKGYLRRAATPVEERFIGNARIFSDQEKEELLMQRNLPSVHEVTAPFYREAASYDDVTKMQYIDIHTWMTGDILVKADKMTMANSLELRVPFLDHHVFEYAATIPAKYKISHGTTKYVLRQAFSGLLPAAAVNRPKRGFPVPTRAWLRSSLQSQVEELLLESPLIKYFSGDVIRKLLADHREARADNSRHLWVLVILAVWMEQFIK